MWHACIAWHQMGAKVRVSASSVPATCDCMAVSRLCKLILGFLCVALSPPCPWLHAPPPVEEFSNLLGGRESMPHAEVTCGFMYYLPFSSCWSRLDAVSLTAQSLRFLVAFRPQSDRCTRVQRNRINQRRIPLRHFRAGAGRGGRFSQEAFFRGPAGWRELGRPAG